MANHQQVTNTLKAAGFKASRKVKVTEGNRRFTKIANGYKVRQFGPFVAVECCNCLNDKDAIFKVLVDAGLEVSDLGNGMLKVA